MNSKDIRRNYWLIFGDITCFHSGFVILDAATVLPFLLSMLTDSSLIIGLVIAIKPLGLFIPQIWSAHCVSKMSHQKHFLIKMACISRIAVLLFSMVLFSVGEGHKTIVLIAFLLMYTAFWLSEGSVQVAWTDLVAKTIPEKLRGRLFGNTQAIGGAIGVFVGIFATWALSKSGPPYPLNFGLLILTSGILLSMSYVSISQVKEPESEPLSDSVSVADYSLSLFSILRKKVDLRRFLAVFVISGCFGMAQPFFILYAKETSHLSGGDVGTLLTVLVIGVIVFSWICGYANDHINPRFALLITLFCGVISCALACIAANKGIFLWGAVFLFVGGFNGSIWVTSTSYILELADESERKEYICLMQIMNGCMALFPVIGGLLVRYASYMLVFEITLAVMLVDLILTFRLRSVRKTA